MTTCSDGLVSQLPGEFDIKMVIGNDLSLAIQWNLDITGYTFEAYIEPKNQAEDIPIDLEITSASSGKMNMIISASSTVNLPASTNEWYMNWTSSSGLKRTILAGNLTLVEE